MGSLPTITIVVTTWFPPGEDGDKRYNIFREALASWHQHLKYDGELHYHIADDGTFAWPGLPPPATFSRQNRRGVGASLNAGFAQAFAQGELALYAVDDWKLAADLDLTPWARLLRDSSLMGCVRLGPPHPDLTGAVLHLGENGWALLLEKHHYAFGFRPALYHKRFFDYYGWFDEGISSLEAERLYNERFCENFRGPDIVLALFTPFDHIYGVELSAVVP